MMGLAAGLVAAACLAVPARALAGSVVARGATHIASGQQKPEEIFKTVCSNCHGPKGKGDGPAGVAFNPRPANFTDPAFWKTHTDSVMIHSITNGKGMMPPFGSTYDQATIKGLVAYIHTLSGQKQGGSPPSVD
jgi:mono/diheme cytochrome c family protein